MSTPVVHPPHLPARTVESDVSPHSDRIRTFVVGIIFSVAAGMVGALIVVAWVVPSGYMTEGQWIPRGQNQSGATPYVEPDTTVARRVKNTTVEIFQGKAILENGYYPESARLGTGVMLSSNGWGMWYAPDVASRVTTLEFRMRGDQGTWYTPTTVVADTDEGYVYFKLTGNEFYVTSFPDWRTLASALPVWVYDQGAWRRQAISSLERIQEGVVFSAYDERFRFQLSPYGISEDGLVYNDVGNLIGFVDADGKMKDAWRVEYTIPTLLESGRVPATAGVLRGSMVEAVEEGQIVKGFLIESLDLVLGESLKQGDIIRAVEGVPITEYTLNRVVRQLPATMNVWRDGELFDILVDR